MRCEARLTPHFFLSQLTASPHAGHAGIRNEPLGYQVENLQRLAQTLELVRSFLMGADVHVLRAFRRSASSLRVADSTAHDGRSVDFIAPAFGTPRDICAHLVAQGLVFDRLVNCGDWVQLDIPKFMHAPRRQLQTGVFDHGGPMRYLEGLL